MKTGELHEQQGGQLYQQIYIVVTQLTTVRGTDTQVVIKYIKCQRLCL